MNRLLLTLNAGSSSLKFAVFEGGEGGLKRRLGGEIKDIGRQPRTGVRNGAGEAVAAPVLVGKTHEALIDPLLSWLRSRLGGDALAAIGHRIVHGGPMFSEPIVLSDGVMRELEGFVPLAPLHQPHNLSAIRAARRACPDLPQIGCFDTAFHHGHADVVTRFALPRQWFDRGVRRYGFHGLSYAFVSERLGELDPELAAGRVVVAHLGAGASLCAIHDGRSVDTTMGFTALDGLMMGTRCGALDPGVVLYLQQEAGLTPQEVQDMLYHQSGLLGVSGISSDMRELLGNAAREAREAIDLFCFRIARETGALMASMGGLDGIVFTAGIGEHAPAIRAEVARRLAWLGFELDSEANRRGEGVISAPGSPLKAWVVPTDEELMIARATDALVDRPTHSGTRP